MALRIRLRKIGLISKTKFETAKIESAELIHRNENHDSTLRISIIESAIGGPLQEIFCRKLKSQRCHTMRICSHDWPFGGGDGIIDGKHGRFNMGPQIISRDNFGIHTLAGKIPAYLDDESSCREVREWESADWYTLEEV